MKDGRHVGIEVKTDAGRLSGDQHEFCRAVTLASGDYLVAHSIDDVVRFRL
jgi:hypothetical protein